MIFPCHVPKRLSHLIWQECTSKWWFWTSLNVHIIILLHAVQSQRRNIKKEGFDTSFSYFHPFWATPASENPLKSLRNGPYQDCIRRKQHTAGFLQQGSKGTKKLIRILFHLGTFLSLEIQSPCQLMIGVYHSQKVVGSLGSDTTSYPITLI